MQFLHTLEVLFVVIAVFSLPFCLVAPFIKGAASSRALWMTLVAYSIVLNASCVYKLSGLARGVVDPGVIVYYLCVSAAGIVAPMAISAAVLQRAQISTPIRAMPPRDLIAPMIRAWLAAIASTPLATVGIYAVDFVYLRQ